MIYKIKDTRLFITIKPYLVCLYNKFYDLKLETIVLKDRIKNLFNKKPKIMSIEESIKYIIENKFSLSRFGDGEMKLICGNRIFFQPFSKELSKRLKEVMNSNEDNHIIGIPDVFGSLNQYSKEPRKYWSKNLCDYRKYWYDNLDMNKKYINSFISRCYMTYKNKDNSAYYFELIKKLWDNKDIIIVEGDESRLGIGNDLFNNAKSIQRILGPKENAFRVYNDILKELKKIDKEKIIFLALGPTATVLAYDLSKLGYQAIDIGHIDIEYEWFLQGAKEKVAIENKYVGEAKGGQVVGISQDKKYLEQIIAKVL